MRVVSAKVEDEVYDALVGRAREEGVSVSELVKRALAVYLGRPVESTATPNDRLKQFIQRAVQDFVNPFTQKVDEVARRLASIVERLDALEDRIKGVEDMVKELKTGASKEEKKARRTAMDILRKQRIMFESDVARKIRDRDTFFSKLQKEGAVVIEVKDGRVAVEPGFWSQFTEKLKSIRTSNDEELKKHLDKEEYMLLKALRESALLVFDATTKTWSTVGERYT